MSAMKIAASSAERARRAQSGVGRLATPTISATPTIATTSSASAAPIDRDQLLDRLQHLRTILPVFAQELATARRHATQLRRDNRRLLEEVHRLQRKHGERNAAR
jgi:hypothetical protein